MVMRSGTGNRSVVERAVALLQPEFHLVSLPNSRGQASQLRAASFAFWGTEVDFEEV